MVSDDEILNAYKLLAQKDGVFCEPASAASVAGLLKYHKQLDLKSGSTVVCVLTGHGLKDPNIAIKQTPELSDAIEPDIDNILEKINF